jgi:hypothetical protein
VESGIGDAKQLVDATARFEKARADDAYDQNLAPRSDAIRENTFSLYEENKKIRDGMADAPNYQKANQQLKAKFDELLANPPKDLDPRSMEDWEKTMRGTYQSIERNNLNWGTKAAQTVGKKRAAAANLNSFNLIRDNVRDAARQGLPVNAGGGLDLNEKGGLTEYYSPSDNPNHHVIQQTLNADYFTELLSRPLVPNPERPDDLAIFDDINNLSGVADKTFLGFTTKKGETKQEKGTGQIQAYFDDVKNSIDGNSLLSNPQKNALKARADEQQRSRQREFDTWMQAGQLELQSNLGRTADLDDLSDYLNGLIGQNAETELEINPYEGNKTKGDINSTDILANLTFGNDYTSVAMDYEYRPLGDITSFSSPLKEVLSTMDLPVGSWNKKELYDKYAPNGTIQETQALETLLRNSPNLSLTGEDIDSMKQENGFDETAWAHDMISEISTMPDSTNEEKQRKQAAANHAMYQAQKEINSGNGFTDKNLLNYFNYAMVGDGGNTALIEHQDLIQQTNTMLNNLREPSITDLNGKPQINQSNSIINKGLNAAMTQYAKDGDKDAFVKNVKSINKDVLATKYQGVIDINDMEDKRKNGESAFFMYNGQPYEYMGFSGKDVFIKSGNKKSKLGV